MMVVKANLALSLQESIGNLWQEDDSFTDCIVVVENTSFKCHRFILGACSNFFHRLFRSQMKESLIGVVHLYEMSKTTFETILNSIYRGIDVLTEDNILDVWSATEFLQIDYLINECKNFAGQNVLLDNWCRTLNHAVMYSAQNVIDVCLDFITKNFENVRNEGSFLHMAFDYFYQIIGSDHLVADCEDSVVEAVLKWVDYKPGLDHCHWMFCGALENKAASERQSQANILQHDLSLSDSQEYCSNGQKNGNDCSEKRREKQEKGNKEQTDLRNNTNNSLLECVEDKVEDESNTTTAMSMLVDGKTVYNKNDNSQVVYREADRKQHFPRLLSACRYLLVKQSYIENLMHNHTQLFVDTGTYTSMFNALKYTTCVDRRHDCWPESAIYRTSSPNKHVMVFLSQGRFMAYGLDTDKVHEVTVEVGRFVTGVTVFDNVFYLHTLFTYNNSRAQRYNHRLAMLTTRKQWVTINEQKMYIFNFLFAHDRYIYGLCQGNLLYRCNCTGGQNEQWEKVCELKITANCLVRFRECIVLFTETDSAVTACYYYPVTHRVRECSLTLDGTSVDMASFTHGEDVYILQINGSLWKLFSTYTSLIHSELVCKLWDCDCSLKGCILYKNALFIFFDQRKMIPNLLVTSLPGLCENIKIIKLMNTNTRCLPMVLHESWFTS